MKRILILIILICIFATEAYAAELTAPPAPSEAQPYMPPQSKSFGADLWYIIKQALSGMFPSIKNATQICISVIAVVLITALIKNINSASGKSIELAGTISIGAVLISSSNAMIRLAISTVESMSDYGKLLLPVMTTALAGEGGVASSTALYTGTVIFDTVLTSIIAKLIVPFLYAYLAVSIVMSAVDSASLKNFKGIFKWLMTWTLKLGIYIFTGYLGITKVVTGTTDAMALKATKLTLSGTVPIVGGIISDASEAILVGTGLMKNTAGIYGIFAVISICLVPFLTIGTQYLLLKLTAGVCEMFHEGRHISLIRDFTFALGILLATTGTICIVELVSIVCFLKGVS